MTFNLGTGLYTGQIDPSSSKSFHQEYQDTLALVRLTEAEGLDSAWVSEHHGSADGYLPSLLPMLAAFAAVTERIELGTGVVLAPFHDPLRLAEDFAVVDQISGGRVIAGLALGWRDEEYRAFGIDPSTKVGRTIEISKILRLAWTEDRFDFEGKYFHYKDVAVTPKPARVPPLLIGGFVDPAIARAGRIGDGYISSRADPQRIAESFELAASARSEAGLEGAPIVALLQNTFVTEDPERDWPAVHAGIGHQLGVYRGWRSGSDVPGVPLQVTPPSEDDIRRTTAYGTPEQVIEYLAGTVGVLGSYPESHLVVRLHYPGMDVGLAARSIELFAREVAPRLREIAAG